MSRAVERTLGMTWAPAALIVAAFLSSGAWTVLQLPPVPLSKALQLMTVSVWLLAFGIGFVRFVRPDRRVLMGLLAIAVSIGASYISGGSLLQAAFYDLYGNMPLVQWLAFPVVFALAAGASVLRGAVERGLVIVVGIGCVLCAAMISQQLSFGSSFVFGTTGYSVTALAPLVPIAAYLASTLVGAARIALYAAAAFIAITLGLLSGTTMGALAALFAVSATVLVHPAPARLGEVTVRIARWVSAGLCALLVAGLLFTSVPLLSERWVNEESLAPFDPNVMARVYMWHGAQGMLAERPLLGFGPSGYRPAAVEYLVPEAVQFGPERDGSTDPAVYSPQSPHSLLWEIGTRLGIVGLLAFALLLAAWVATLRACVWDDGRLGGLRLALAAGFSSAAFSLLVNPVLFPIGLFSAAAAGLAVAPLADEPRKKNRTPEAEPVVAGPNVRTAVTVVGVIFALFAVWLGMGEWRLFTAPVDDPNRAIVAFDGARRMMPGHPLASRYLLEARLLVAPDEPSARSVQQEVEAAPDYIHDFAPNLVSLAAYSMAQAERTGRSDLEWERSMLDRAADRLPLIPSLVSERLRLAVLAGDDVAVREALPDAERWGSPYPPAQSYLERAEQLLANE